MQNSDKLVYGNRFFSASSPDPGIFFAITLFIYFLFKSKLLQCINHETGDYWCTPPAELPAKYTADWIARAHPIKIDHHNHSKIDYCHVYAEYWENPLRYFGPNHTIIDTTNLPTIKCTNYSFNPAFNSLVADFGLICGRELLVPLSQCFHIFGLLIGGIVAYFMLK